MSGVYRVIFKNIVELVGLDAAYFLSELIAQADFCQAAGRVDDNGFFILPVKQMEKLIGFDRNKQARVIQRLEDAKLIETDRRVGFDRKFKILENNPDLITQKRVINNSKMSNQLPENELLNNSKMSYSMLENELLNNSKMSDSFIYTNSSMNSFKSSCKSEDEQQQIQDEIIDYFVSKIKDEKKARSEAYAFINYNRETYGADHITAKNYKKHADAWITALKHPPKKKTGDKAKTAAEAAAAEGMAVLDYLNKGGRFEVDKIQEHDRGVIVTMHPDTNTIKEVFGEVQ